MTRSWIEVGHFEFLISESCKFVDSHFVGLRKVIVVFVDFVNILFIDFSSVRIFLFSPGIAIFVFPCKIVIFFLFHVGEK